MLKTITHLFDASITAAAGGKAFRLAQLHNADLGLHIPAGFVLPYAWLQKWQIETTKMACQVELTPYINQLFTSGCLALAVRSSANIEDGNTASFAGQFDSFLNLTTAQQVFEAIDHCLLALNNERLMAYCAHNGIPLGDIQLNILLQIQVNALAAGVAFTANPLTGNDKEIAIEAVPGLGDGLVQGIVNPSIYKYNWYSETLEKNDELLSASSIEKLVNVCLTVQKHYGLPMDLEWALANETIYLLQARPLTKITYQVSDEWTNADLKDGGVASAICTPIMYSMYKTVFESTMPGYFEQIKIGHPDKNKKWFDWWFGYPYWNLSAAKKCVGQLPGFVERNFDISLGITPNYDGNGQTTKLNIFSVIKGLRALYATNNSIANRIANCQMAIQKAHQSFHLYEKTNWADLSFEETVSLCESLFEEYLSFEKSYFLAIYDNSNMATFCQEAIQKHNAKNPQNLINYLDVIGGLENLAHLRANESLQKLAREINKNESARQFFLLQTPETLCKKLLAKEPFLFCDELNACIITYKHHSPRELDLMTPNWDENPTPAIELLLYFIQKGEPETEGSVNDKFAGQWKNIANKRIKSKIQKHRDLLWWREEMRDNSTKMYYYVRKCLLHMGVHLAKNNATANADDVFFLSYPELIHLAKGIDSAKHLSIIAKNKCLYESFRNYSRPNEIRPYGAQSATQSDATNADVLQGIAGASGIYRGRAVVITHVFDGHKLNDGDILVTVYTDPGWTVYFSKINALITETGGMLSHGAVISREYGIPAVLGVKDATQLIKTGDIIEVNGQLGTVQIIR